MVSFVVQINAKVDFYAYLHVVPGGSSPDDRRELKLNVSSGAYWYWRFVKKVSTIPLGNIASNALINDCGYCPTVNKV